MDEEFSKGKAVVIAKLRRHQGTMPDGGAMFFYDKERDMNLNLDYVLKRIKGKVVCAFDEEKREFSSGDEAFAVYGGRGQNEEYYVVNEISAEGDAVVLEVKDIRPEINKNVEEFERKHFEEYGVYPNPFDGA